MEESMAHTIEHIFYINLDKRIDRKEHVLRELDKVAFTHDAKRFPAVEMENGAIGCSMSHLKCLQLAKEQRWSHVMILEDDIEFTDPSLCMNQLDLFLKRNTMGNPLGWDVLLIAGNNMIPYVAVDDTCVQVYNCQTTTGYIVQAHYYDTLIQNIKEGMQLLLRNPTQASLYAIDKYWLRLQKRDTWFLLVPLTVVQREDYSDIEGRITHFRSYMLNLNKAYKK